MAEELPGMPGVVEGAVGVVSVEPPRALAAKTMAAISPPSASRPSNAKRMGLQQDFSLAGAAWTGGGGNVLLLL